MPSEVTHTGQFRKGSERAREAGRKGGLVRAAKRRAEHGRYTGTILDVMDAAGLTGDSWEPWRVFWRAVYALPMDDEALATFQAHTEREDPPEESVSEAWMPIGRRGGKSRNAAVAALYSAIAFDSSTLAPGELAVVPVLAPDRKQGRVVMGYLRGLLELLEFAPYVHRILKETVELHNGVNIEIATASFRTIRGYTVPAAVLDEVAFWYDDGANPDSEVLQALRPAMATVPGSLLLGLSSPYACRGELYKAVERSFGQDDPRSLVWNADTASMNPEVPAHIIEEAFEEDPVAAASEYGRDGRVQFRRDVEAFLDVEAVRAVTVEGRREIAPHAANRYAAFVDPSGGSQDSFTLAVAHAEGDLAVLDVVRERRPPFSPDEVVKEFADLLRAYGVSSVTGDRYGGQWPQERFQRHGIRYEPSERTKSDIYREFVAPVNAGSVALLDLPVLRAQLQGLERRVARGGRDSIDHGPGGRDDVANAAAGALTLVGATTRVHYAMAPSPWG